MSGRFALPYPWINDPQQLGNNQKVAETLSELLNFLYWGAGVPTFTPAGPVALFLRRDGGAGSSLYVYENGAWAAK